MTRRATALSALLLACNSAPAPLLDVPERPDGVATGSEIARELRGLDLEAREARVLAEVASGNMPGWLRRMRPVEIRPQAARVGAPGEQGAATARTVAVRTVTFWATPDYLAVGSDEDFLRIPLSPGTAQRIAELTGTSLPTPTMVDAIWEAAAVRLGPTPIPPNRLMTTVAVFEDHDRKVQRQRDRARASAGALVAGHKKDVVLTPRLAESSDHVAIYGWHDLSGEPIQPLYLGHTDDWVDYSHGIRLVDDTVWVDGEPRALADVLTDPEVAPALSEEGVLVNARYGRSREGGRLTGTGGA